MDVQSLSHDEAEVANKYSNDNLKHPDLEMCRNDFNKGEAGALDERDDEY